ncbi:MAG: DUF1731 domain-containing protein [Aridibacter famidurans]|nr:DUF1731 domain-containing protein [Aridibacter famidurans]
MKIVIPGGSGQVGTVLRRFLESEGHEVYILTRHPDKDDARQITWDGSSRGGWTKSFEGADAVINLAGRSVNCRYTPANRREIKSSRVDSTRVVGEAIAAAKHPPKVWLQMSTATIYEHTYGPPNDDLSGVIGGNEPGAPDTWNFSIDVATSWEKAAFDARDGGTPRVSEGAGSGATSGGTPRVSEGAGSGATSGGTPRVSEGAGSGATSGGTPRVSEGAGGTPRVSEGAGSGATSGGTPRVSEGAGGTPHVSEGAGGTPRVSEGAGSGATSGGTPSVSEGAGGTPRVSEGAERGIDSRKTRMVLMRSAIVMSPDRGGPFDILLNLVRFGLGGTAGDGRQFVSWVHDEDFARAVLFLIGNASFEGPVNIAAPNPLPNKEFMSGLREAWGMPFGIPSPEFLLEIGAFFLRTETELVLKSRRVVSKRLTDAGFEFGFTDWKEAAEDLCRRWKVGT